MKVTGHLNTLAHMWVQEQLKREGKIRSFNLRLKANEFAFMFVDDYIAQVEVERRKVKQAAHELVFGTDFLSTFLAEDRLCTSCRCIHEERTPSNSIRRIYRERAP